LAVFDIEILRSVQGGVAPHHRSPASAMKPAGQDPRARQSPKLATVPLCLRRNASLFRIILLLISGMLEHPIRRGHTGLPSCAKSLPKEKSRHARPSRTPSGLPGARPGGQWRYADIAEQLIDQTDLLNGVGGRNAAFTLPAGRGDEGRHPRASWRCPDQEGAGYLHPGPAHRYA
jgi:hypothetical protein